VTGYVQSAYVVGGSGRALDAVPVRFNGSDAFIFPTIKSDRTNINASREGLQRASFYRDHRHWLLIETGGRLLWAPADQVRPALNPQGVAAKTGGNGTTVDTAVYSDLRNVRGTVGAPAQLFADDGTYRASAIADDATARSVLLCWKIATGERYTEISTDPITGMHSLDVCDLATRAAFAGDVVFQVDKRRDIPAMTWCGKTGTAVGLEWCGFQVNTPRIHNSTVIAPAGVTRSVFDNKFQVVGGLVGVVVRASNGNDLKGYSTLVKLAATAMTNFDTLDVGSLDEDLIALDNCLLPWPHGIAPLV
jgi:hypothetical protein